MGAGDDTWSPLTVAGLLAFFGLAACLPFAEADSRFLHGTSRAARLVAMTVVVSTLGAFVLTLVASWLENGPGPDADTGLLATLRTAVIAAGALALAGLSRWRRLYDASLLVVPVLVLGGIKLVIKDFPLGRPSTLFIALALYGTTLIVAPRLARWQKSEESSA